MYHIHRVIIRNLWGQDKDFDLPLGGRDTFLVGDNGSGKTTVVSIIAAVIHVDLNALRNFWIDTAILVLSKKGERKKTENRD